MKFLKNLFKKVDKKQEYIDKVQLESDVFMKSLGKYMFGNDDCFSFENFFSKKVDYFLEKNLHSYFGNQFYKKKINDVLEFIVDKKLKEQLEQFFTVEVENQVKSELLKISLWDIKNTKTFEEFVKNHFSENKYNLATKIEEILNSDNFVETLSEKIGAEIGEKLQDKLKASCKY